MENNELLATKRVLLIKLISCEVHLFFKFIQIYLLLHILFRNALNIVKDDLMVKVDELSR